MTDTNIRPMNIVVDIAPLWELQYTGISNVVCEVASRALYASEPGLTFTFTAFQLVVPRDIIAACVGNLNGATLRDAVQSGQAVPIDRFAGINPAMDVGLFLHVKPPSRRYRKEAHLYYDLSYLSVPETHSADTVEFHLNELASQVATTDQFFTISKSTALDLQWYFDIPDEKVKVTYLGHNTDLAQADAFITRSFGREAEPFIMVLGTIEPRKNVSFLLDWLAQNPRVMDLCRFVFCGREGWGESFAQLIERYGLQGPFAAGRIVHFGYVSQSQKAALLSAAQALVYPSLFEGFGLPVLEAMAQSVPVLASCSTSIPEVLGEDGFYFDPYSTESFTAAFADFIKERRSGALAARAERLRQRSTTFTYDNMFSQMLETMVTL